MNSAENRAKWFPGIVQRMERGNVFIDLGRTTGILLLRNKYRASATETANASKHIFILLKKIFMGINIRLSRTHPKLIEELFKQEVPEIANGVVEIKSIAREPGSRSKSPLPRTTDMLDLGRLMLGQRGVRVSTVMNELGGEKIDIIGTVG